MKPIFDGPPVFILLAIIVALAGYLRQVSIGALTLIHNIERDAADAFPYNLACDAVKKKKLSLLEGTRSGLAKVTHGLFWMMFLVALRILLIVVESHPYALALKQQSLFDKFRYMFAVFLSETFRYRYDIALSFLVVGLVIAMSLMHWQGRKRDEPVRQQALSQAKYRLKQLKAGEPVPPVIPLSQ